MWRSWPFSRRRSRCPVNGWRICSAAPSGRWGWGGVEHPESHIGLREHLVGGLGRLFIISYIGKFGNVIIPTDCHIFQRGWNHQPEIYWDTETNYWDICIYCIYIYMYSIKYIKSLSPQNWAGVDHVFFPLEDPNVFLVCCHTSHRLSALVLYHIISEFWITNN